MATWTEFVDVGFEVAQSKGLTVTGSVPNQATELMKVLGSIWREYDPSTRQRWSRSQVRSLLEDELVVT